MYLLILPLVFLLTFNVAYNLKPKGDARRLVLWSGVVMGAYAVLATEGLTVVRLVTPTYLIIAWVVPLVFLSYFLFHRIRSGKKILFPQVSKPEGCAEYGLSLGIAIILILTALVAWKTPPQTWDSLNYHMSRVAHWAQQRGLQHYATGIEVQNNMAPGAEIMVLQSYLLSASDQWVNFIQWFAMLGSLIGVSYIAHQLGGGSRAQLFAAVFAVSIPIGIVEATTTMTDYVVTFWIICVAAESLEISNKNFSIPGVAVLATSAGLAALTKPTAFAFLFPFAVLISWQLIRRWQTWSVKRAVMLTVVIVIILNLAHSMRNVSTYANPIGPEDRFDQHANQLISLRGLTSNLIRNTAMNLQTPSPHANKAIAMTVQWIHRLMGLEVNDPRTTAAGRFKVSTPSTNEILAGNPLHMLFMPLIFGIIIWWRNRLEGRVLLYSAVLVGGGILFSLLFKWLIFGTRLQLPLFVLAAPMFGIVVGESRRTFFANIMGWVLLLASLPWLLSVNSRPIIPHKERSYVESILVESRTDLLFANGEYLKEPTRDVVLHISEIGCTDVGLMLAGNSVEYTFWAMFGAPRTQVQFEWIVKGTPSAIYSSPAFDACAIICENCPFGEDAFRDLTLVHERAPYSLYLQDELSRP